MRSVAAYVADSSGGPLTRTAIPRRPVGPADVLIDIHYAGVCHTDIHIARNEWGTTHYPVVPGHEIAGVVREVGSEVTSHRPGDRVGVGCFVDACHECDACTSGVEQHCLRGATLTYNSLTADGTVTYGGYSSAIVVDHRFVVSIPDAIPLDAAAPIMCAGTTVYAPLRRFGVGTGTRVGIIGLGGLGHLGVMIARALGAEVTVLSQSSDKRDDALRFGATRHFTTGAAATFDELAGTFDVVLNTVSSKIDLNPYFATLARYGVLVELGIPDAPLELDGFSLILGDRSFAGSFVGSVRQTREVLELCAENGIRPQIEVVAASRVNEVFASIIDGRARYRYVLDTREL
ncbi:NAD(P)-dependent alcohol dehydrogenase [Nocardia sp. NPDC050793]|uniref:NAD(P)-dependent alcohol dehydrogenase n=1 Tax=Nocardia sp. NPDC050793 TaxID=3155159 RepID=UPI00341060F3